MEEKELRTALTHWLICNKDFEMFKKGERYWLGENIKLTGFTFASYFYPQVPVVDGCKYFLDKKNY